MSEIISFAKTNFRNQEVQFGIKQDDRRRHFYVIGKTGMGKTNMLENMAIQDIRNGHGVCFIDPHGDTAEKLISMIPTDRLDDVIYFNPADQNFPIAFNVMEKVEPEFRPLIASGLIGVFKKLWADSWGPRLEYILRNAILGLLEYPGSTLLGVMRILVEKNYRKRVTDKITDPIVRSFWVDEFPKWSEKQVQEVISPIQNKVGQFLTSPIIRNIIGQSKSTFNIREVMDDRKILILNLAKGRIGEDNSSLIGAMIITKIQLAAMERVDMPEEERKDFYLYVDEFQNFATESFANILSEARKYRLNLILANQYITQLDEKVRDAIFGNAGTIVSFRVGATDAEFLEKEFEPVFMMNDIVNLPKYGIYLKLMIDGIAGDAFSATTLPPVERLEEDSTEQAIQMSRERYSISKQEAEERIARLMGILPESDLMRNLVQKNQVRNNSVNFNSNKPNSTLISSNVDKNPVKILGFSNLPNLVVSSSKQVDSQNSSNFSNNPNQSSTENSKLSYSDFLASEKKKMEELQKEVVSQVQTEKKVEEKISLQKTEFPNFSSFNYLSSSNSNLQKSRNTAKDLKLSSENNEVVSTQKPENINQNLSSDSTNLNSENNLTNLQNVPQNSQEIVVQNSANLSLVSFQKNEEDEKIAENQIFGTQKKEEVQDIELEEKNSNLEFNQNFQNDLVVVIPKEQSSLSQSYEEKVQENQEMPEVLQNQETINSNIEISQFQSQNQESNLTQSEDLTLISNSQEVTSFPEEENQIENELETKSIESEELTEKPEKQFFQTNCSTCDTEIEIPFQPDGIRPVFCRECLKDYQRAVAKAKEEEMQKNNSENLESNSNQSSFSGEKNKKKGKRRNNSERSRQNPKAEFKEQIFVSEEKPLSFSQIPYIAPKKFSNTTKKEVDFAGLREMIQKVKNDDEI